MCDGPRKSHVLVQIGMESLARSVQCKPPQPTWGSIPEWELGPVPVMSRVSGKPYFVYVLWSPSGHRFYTGISEDPQHRTDQHNQGISRWTARYRPWEFAHVERFNTYTDARKRELQLKAQKPVQGVLSACRPWPRTLRPQSQGLIIPLCGIDGPARRDPAPATKAFGFPTFPKPLNFIRTLRSPQESVWKTCIAVVFVETGGTRPDSVGSLASCPP